MGIQTASLQTIDRKKVGLFLLDHAMEIILIVLIILLAQCLPDL